MGNNRQMIKHSYSTNSTVIENLRWVQQISGVSAKCVVHYLLTSFLVGAIITPLSLFMMFKNKECNTLSSVLVSIFAKEKNM
jgi:predicted PurR-regulated permease PerM